MIRHIDLKDIDWLGILDQIPIQTTEQDEQKRKELWLYFDPNGNGLVSQAEADLAFRQMGPVMLPIYFAKKVQHAAFKIARNSNPGKSQTADDYMEKSEFHTYLYFIIRYFGYYFMFKSLDLDFDERVKVDDFIREMVQLRHWGLSIADAKEARKAFYEYDKNRGGLLLFDEWIQFCDDHKLNIEKHYLLQEALKRPRIVYKKYVFLKAGEKRPIDFERPERPTMAERLNRSRSSNGSSQQEKRISRQLYMQQKKLSLQQEMEKKLSRNKSLTIKQKLSSLQFDYSEQQKQEDLKKYEQLKQQIRELEEQNIIFQIQAKQIKDQQKNKKQQLISQNSQK